MKKFVLFLCLVGCLSCDKEDDPDKHSSIKGYWVVRTPDDETRVTFRIAQDSDNEYLVENVIVEHSGTNYDTKPIDAGVNVISSTAIESVTMVNSSTSPPFFVIRFQEISVSSDFTEMQINISSFNIDGNFRQFPMIKGTRD